MEETKPTGESGQGKAESEKERRKGRRGRREEQDGVEEENREHSPRRVGR